MGATTEPVTVGQFTWDIEADQWTGERELLIVHGLRPERDHPSIDDLMAQKHPDDVDDVLRTIHAAMHTGQPFHCLHRIVHPDGAERSVCAVGQVGQGDSGHHLMRGYFVDLTDFTPDPHVQHRLDDACETLWHLRRAWENRPVIEQAKGMIMLMYQCDADTAWQALVMVSQLLNLKARTIARQLVDTVLGNTGPDGEHVATRLHEAARTLGLKI